MSGEELGPDFVTCTTIGPQLQLLLSTCCPFGTGEEPWPLDVAFAAGSLGFQIVALEVCRWDWSTK